MGRPYPFVPGLLRRRRRHAESRRRRTLPGAPPRAGRPPALATATAMKFVRLAERHPLSPHQLAVLRLLDERGPLRKEEVAEALGMGPTSVGHPLWALHERGLAACSWADRRWALTEAGREAARGA